MRKVKATIITSHPDLHGERCDPDSLEPVAVEMNRKYLPLNVEHDLRKPPVGRIIGSEVIQLEDGERAIESTVEIFEEGDSADLVVGDGRSMEIATDDIPTFKVEYDRSFSTEDGQRFLSELRTLSQRSEFSPVVKKALEPISTLTVAAGIFAVGAIATGFLKKLGEDLYDRLKEALIKRYQEQKSSAPQLLDLRFTVLYKGDFVEIHVLLENPTGAEIEALFKSGLAKLDQILSRIDTGELRVAKFVFGYRDGQWTILYAVSYGCAPLRLV